MRLILMCLVCWEFAMVTPNRNKRNTLDVLMQNRRTDTHTHAKNTHTDCRFVGLRFRIKSSMAVASPPALVRSIQQQRAVGRALKQ